jgi:hypothetical protein
VKQKAVVGARCLPASGEAAENRRKPATPLLCFHHHHHHYEHRNIEKGNVVKKYKIILLLGLALAVFVPAAFGQTCTPAGRSPIAPLFPYDFIANGLPSSSNCWSVNNASFVTGTTACGWTSNAFEFAYGGSVDQYVTVPSSDTSTHFSLSYLVDFDDPNNDSYWNNLQVSVIDVGPGVTIASDYYNGGMPDLYCSRRVTATFNGSLAGHTLVVHFSGSSAYSNTHIRIRMISLWGW